MLGGNGVMAVLVSALFVSLVEIFQILAIPIRPMSNNDSDGHDHQISAKSTRQNLSPLVSVNTD